MAPLSQKGGTLLGATLVAVLLLFAFGPVARAQDAEDDEPVAASAPGRRPVPDLDGRPEREPDATEQLLWIPRVLFSPLYFVSELVIRRPLGALATAIEREEIVQHVIDFLTFGPDKNIGVIPTVFYEFGLSPSVGLYAFWNQFLARSNRISAHAATWGPRWLSFTASDQLELTSASKLTARVHLERRPDQIFTGIGYDSTGRADESPAERSRYTVEEVDASLAARIAFFRRSEIGYAFGYRSRGFLDRGWDDEASIGTFVGQLGDPLPPGFESGYESFRLRIHGALDTRPLTPLPVGGARLAGYVEQHVGFGGLPDSRWIRAAGEALLSVELFEQRVFGVTGAVAAIIPTSSGAIVPFAELIDPGNLGPLSGFQQGVLRGHTAAALTFHYTWNVWPFVNGELRWTVGNVFGPDFEDFQLDRLRMSFALGIVPGMPGGEQLFDLSVSVGTETFERHAEINNVRFTFGTRSWL
jgi:hypothetical protein